MQIDQIHSSIMEQQGYKSKVINGRTYVLRLMPGMMGFAVAMKLFKTFLPALGAYFDGQRRADFILPDEDSLFTEIAVHLTSSLDKLDILATVEGVLSDLSCNGTKVDINEHFRGKQSEMLKVLEWGMKENFSDFFTDFLKEKGFDLSTLNLKQTTESAPE